jgi:hypothetical protein
MKHFWTSVDEGAWTQCGTPPPLSGNILHISFREVIPMRIIQDGEFQSAVQYRGVPRKTRWTLHSRFIVLRAVSVEWFVKLLDRVFYYILVVSKRPSP